MRRLFGVKLLGIPVGLLLLAVLAVGALAATSGTINVNFGNTAHVGLNPPNITAMYQIDALTPQVLTNSTVDWGTFHAGDQTQRVMVITFTNTGEMDAVESISMPAAPAHTSFVASADNVTVVAGGQAQITVTLTIMAEAPIGDMDLGHIVIAGSY